MNGILERAAGEKQNLEMVYMDGKGRMTQRIVRVVAVREETILGYCYWRKQVRSFKRDNILSVYPVEERKGMAL
ncbi:hypothetical protein [Salimicrobium halophilum]|uniref:WYL domain-containing protein n=1 Tax=Salimicrobium halophilum TaxID=86666 RepID=A0A1G8UIV8_9BACI|nr:hypothetical protein [Salimicrobium halophilum]SDJ52850.1 hypothetical protein SAMN04490247_2249 [Salimicrobium halophilum]